MVLAAQELLAEKGFTETMTSYLANCELHARAGSHQFGA
jgi:hypothetical protein